MTDTTFVAIIAGVFSLLSIMTSTIINLYINKKDNNRRNEIINNDKKLKNWNRYEPLLSSAYDLQSRIYNILILDFSSYLKYGTERQIKYHTYNTLYLFCQYFGYSEIFRINICQTFFFDDETVRKITLIQDDIVRLFSSDRNPKFGSEFQIYAGEQRELGESVLNQAQTGIMGYGEFMNSKIYEKIENMKFLRLDIESLPEKSASDLYRLLSIQRRLVDLINEIDPRFLRFPEKRTTQIPLTPPEPPAPRRR